MLGKHSRSQAIAQRAEALGFSLSGNELGQVFASFKRRADEIGEVDDGELVSIINMSATDAFDTGGKRVAVS